MQESERIQRVLSAVAHAGARFEAGVVGGGPGDDAARLLAPPGHELVWTVDDHVEGTHFRRGWGLIAVGRKATGAALSDLAASAAQPLGALLSLVLPSETHADELTALGQGVGEKLRACGCPLLGGNVTRGEQLTLSITALGSVPAGYALCRDQARPGDVLYVTGPLGRARAGLLWLERGGRPDDEDFADALSALLDPQPRFDVARQLATHEGRVAGMDLSDGLATDLPRLLRASQVAAKLETLPTISPKLAAQLRQDPQTLAGEGGEDYELLLAAPRGLELEGITLYPIGQIEHGEPGHIQGQGQARAWDPFDPPNQSR